MIASSSLRDALDRFSRYFEIVSTALQLRFEEQEESYTVRYDRWCGEFHDAAIDLAMGLVVELSRTAYGEDFDPMRLTLRRRQPNDTAPYEQLFRAPIEFGAAEDLLCFRKDELEAHLPTGNPELVVANDEVVSTYLARFEKSTVSNRVMVKIRSTKRDRASTSGIKAWLINSPSLSISALMA